MAEGRISFDIVGDAAKAAAAFTETADTADIAARSARGLAIALEAQRRAAGTSADASLSLARADKILEEAERGLSGETKTVRDRSLEAGGALNFMKDAMGGAAREGDAAARAADYLGISLETTSSVAKKARDRLLELGFAEREAAAGARKLAEAQIALDAAQVGGGGGGMTGFLSLFGAGGSASAAGGIGAVVAIPVIAAVVAEVVALASGFAAATAGAAAFGALAIPTFDKIKNAYTAINTAQQNYNAAVALQKEDPTKAHATAAAAALDKLRVAQESMGPSTRTAVSGIQNLVRTFDAMAKAFQPTVMKVFNDALKVANDLLPVLAPMAQAFGGALDGLLKNVDKFAQSKGFKDWLAQFDKLIGPATTAIGHGIGDVVTNFGKLLTVFSAKDVVNAINIAFRIVSGTLTGLTYVVTQLKNHWVEMASGVVHAWQDVRQWTIDAWHAIDQVAHNIVHAWDNVMHATDNLTHAFDNARHAIAVAATDTWHAIETAFSFIKRIFVTDVGQWIATGVAWFKGLPGRILAAVGNLGSLLFNAGQAVISGLISGIKSALGTLGSVLGSVGSFIASHKGPLDADRQLLVPHGQAIMDGLMAGMSSRTPALRAALSATSRTIAGGVTVPGITGRSGGGVIQLEVTSGGSGEFERFMVEAMKKWVQVRGGGGTNSVQRAFGQAWS